MAHRQLRIVHALGTMNPGGVETWLMHVLRNIDRSRFQLDFCTFGAEPGLYAAEAARLGSEVLRCPKGANLWSFGRRFRRVLREGKYDMVHSHVYSFSGAVLRWANAEGVPMRIAHSHGTNDGRPDLAMRRAYRNLMRSWIGGYATHGLGASREATSALFGDQWERDERFRVLHCGIDLRPFQEQVDREAVRRELSIPVDTAVVGHVGRFDQGKNHRFLLEIAAEVLKLRPDTHFLLVGDGPLRPATENLASSLGLSGKVHFLGVRTDVTRLMCGAMDAFLFPSLWEGLPVTLIEAQAAGLRCVVSDRCTAEASILPDQFMRLSLSKSASEWAANTIEAFERGKVGGDLPVRAIAQTDFCIQRSAGTLCDLYEAAEREWRHAA